MDGDDAAGAHSNQLIQQSNLPVLSSAAAGSPFFSITPRRHPTNLLPFALS